MLLGTDMNESLLLLEGTNEDILIKDGVIACKGRDIPVPERCRVEDIGDCTVFPSFVDIHVHFREPGFSYKETIRTGSLAAAKGGYTTVCTMPNLNPTPDSPENIEKELEIIRRDAAIEVLPLSSISVGRKGEALVDFSAMKPLCVAFSDDGSGVQREAMMRKAMEAAAREDCIITAHCEDESLLEGGYIHDGEYCRRHHHKGICSESEWRQVERDLNLCEEYGCRYHVCHISTAESVELIRRAKENGVRVTCETAPHYLVLCDEDLREEGRFKMNPPIRSSKDRDALLSGLLDGTIDAIATDHAPHSEKEKSLGLEGSAMGVSGLEAAFPVLYTSLVKSGRIPLQKLTELLSSSPRRVYGIKGGPSSDSGMLSVGDRANITVADLNEKHIIKGEEFLSKGHSTPFEGMEVFGRIKMTIWNGKIVYRQ